MAKSITRIDAKKPDLLQRKRVAAYARVSMDTERLMHSLSVQVSYYSELIQNTPGWEYAGVYADEGISGTKMDSRPEFIRMLADCEAGKIDIILTQKPVTLCPKHSGYAQRCPQAEEAGHRGSL